MHCEKPYINTLDLRVQKIKSNFLQTLKSLHTPAFKITMIMMVIIMIMMVITVMIKMKIDDDKRHFFLKGGDHLHSENYCLCKFQLLTSKKQKG